VVQAHVHPDDVVALLHEQRGRERAVHASAHGYHYSLVVPVVCHFSRVSLLLKTIRTCNYTRFRPLGAQDRKCWHISQL
jgi:hypothetical protein